jgi:hypothetical protein
MHNEAGEANPVICNDGGPSTTKEFHAPQVPPEMIIRSSRSRAHVNVGFLVSTIPVSFLLI